MKLRNRLWNPEHEPIRAKQIVKYKPKDPLCEPCINKDVCKGHCPMMQWIDGNAPLKETLLDRHVEPNSNYNDVLAEGISSRRVDFTGQIESIENIKTKCIAVLLQSEIPLKDISRVMKISTRTIYRIKSNAAK